jgi:hypothetical protein
MHMYLCVCVCAGLLEAGSVGDAADGGAEVGRVLRRAAAHVLEVHYTHSLTALHCTALHSESDLH